MERLGFKELLSDRRLQTLLLSLLFGLLMMFSFSGKYRIDLESIAVSQNEQLVACFETGRGHRIRCFYTDGSSAFDYIIPSEISSGGHCALWFDEDVLCALFYRTDTIVHFAFDGSILSITNDYTGDAPPKFPSFSHNRCQYVFEGNEIDVVYDKGSFLGYWFLGSERYLAITPQNEETQIIYAWTATDGVSKQTD